MRFVILGRDFPNVADRIEKRPDAGDDATCPSTDQRGITRPQGAHCDIGAYESRGHTLAKTGGDNQTTAVNTSFALPLQTTLSEMGGSVLAGAVITYTAPSSGASATWNAGTTITRTTDSSGIASAPAPTANGTVGTFAVTASAPGAAAADFSLTNQAATTTVLTSSVNPSTLGQTVVLRPRTRACGWPPG